MINIKCLFEELFERIASLRRNQGRRFKTIPSKNRAKLAFVSSLREPIRRQGAHNHFSLLICGSYGNRKRAWDISLLPLLINFLLLKYAKSCSSCLYWLIVFLSIVALILVFDYTMGMVEVINTISFLGSCYFLWL